MTTPLIHELFEQQAARTPEAVALIAGSRRVTYAELNQRSHQLAFRLRKSGAGPEAFVGVLLERSIDAVIALLGILKAGSAYVYLDPDLPDQRLEDIQTDSRLSLVITNAKFQNRCAKGRIYLDICSVDLSAEDADNWPTKVLPDSTAYVLYTSGSTGTPKGVIGIHRSLTARLASDELPDIRPGDICCLNSSLGVGITASRLFLPLVLGASVVILPDADVKDTRRFMQALQIHHVTSLFLPPSLLRTVLASDAGELAKAAVRAVTVTGSTLTPQLVESFFNALPSAQLINVYGSAEIGTTATLRVLDRNSAFFEGSIGKPVETTLVYLFDDNGNLVSGDVGEIFVSAEHLARGYLNQPDLTREKFVPNPFVPGGRLYRTGDRGRYLPNGEILFLGRRDHQVKIRGFRVELGEIEQALEEFDGLDEAIVTVLRDPTTEHRLIAYFVAGKGRADSSVTKSHSATLGSELRRFLRRRLPSHMVPSGFVRLAQLPRTISGKVDRAALPPYDPARPEVENPYEAPRSPIEAGIARIWAEVLGVNNIGIHDNFLELGGDSLAASRVIFRIRDHYRIELTMESLFDQTIAETAQLYSGPEFL
jgi:amino acid adenylation domain-containing protein